MNFSFRLIILLLFLLNIQLLSINAVSSEFYLPIRCCNHAACPKVKDEKKEKMREKIKIVLKHLAQLMSGLVLIAQDPRNPEFVGAQVAQIATCVVDFGYQIGKKFRQSRSVSHEELLMIIDQCILKLINSRNQKLLKKLSVIE